MKKKVIIGIVSAFAVVITTCLFVMFNSRNRSYEVITNETKEKIMNTNALTMMYETASGSGEYMVSSDSTWPQEGYTFNERLSGCENGSTLTWDDERKAVILSTNVSDRCYVYFDKIMTFASTIENLYTTDGENGLYYHDGQGPYGSQEAGDNSYRYSGANPNNYVCFGIDEETCPADNLYRIIGVFDGEIKLIKNTSIGNIAWDRGDSNTWSSASLNTETLNGTYLSGLGDWANMIVEHQWQVGGNTFQNIGYGTTLKTAYTNEIVSPAENITYQAKIGLMYVSDYGYAASGNYWTMGIGASDSWLRLGSDEWTITRFSDYFSSHLAFFVAGSGNIYEVNNVVSLTYAVRPSFYLTSDTGFVSGDGTQTNPFKIQ